MKPILAHILFCFVFIYLFLHGTGANAQQPLLLPGLTKVGASTSYPVTVRLPNGGSVSKVRVLTQGNEQRDFEEDGSDCALVYAPGQSCVVQIRFNPAAPGLRHGAIVLLDSDMKPLAQQPLAATASGPIATFIPGNIITVAGNASTFFFAGDGGQATKASLFLPLGITLDAANNMYIADTYNNRVRKVSSATGIITTVAGVGSSGSGGDGGSALLANLNNPSTIVLDGFGNLYIADTNNDAVRFVDASTGAISTVAGTIGTPGYSGDSGPGTSATLRSPNGLMFDLSGNLYIADTGNNVIRVLNTTTGLISTFAGTGTASYSGDGGQARGATLNAPFGLALGSGGTTIYVADQGNNVIRAIEDSGIISTIAGTGKAGFTGDGGIASKAQLNTPAGITQDVAGNLYTSDSGNNRIRKINPATNVITTIAGGTATDGDNNPATLANLSGPFAMQLDGAGDLYFADAFHNRIREIQSNVADLDFTTTRINSVTAPQNEIIENDGTEPLDILAVSAVSNARVDASSTCFAGTVVAVLSQCAVAGDFAPTVVGNPTRGSITVGSNASNAGGTIILQGVAVATDPSTVLVTSTPNPSVVGNPVQFTVQVISEGVVPTGTVTLMDGSINLATITLTNGLASTSVATLTVGQHTITASYGGDVNNSSSTSLSYLQVVNVLPPNSGTTSNLSSNANPVQVGVPLTLSATVSALVTSQPAPTGTVSFMEGTTVLGVGNLSSEITSTTIATLTAGTHLITAVYSGSTTYATSTSPVLTQLVTALNPVTTTSLVANADPISAGSSVTLTATVVAQASAQVLPSGTVTFMEGATALGTGGVTSGIATLNVSGLSTGTHLITASYGGNATYGSSISPVLTEIVVAGGVGSTPQFTLTANPSSLTIQSGSHAAVQITITPMATFSDTLAFGCGGLPVAATCTFSQVEVPVAGGTVKTISVVIDTGSPLGAGPSAEVLAPTAKKKAAIYAAWLPGALCLSVLVFRRRRGWRQVLLPLVLLCGICSTMLSGCGTNYTSATTPAGTYSVQIFANGTASGASYATTLPLTVSK